MNEKVSVRYFKAVAILLRLFNAQIPQVTSKCLQIQSEKPKLRCMGVSTVVAASMLGHTVQVNENNYTYDVASMDYKKKVMSEVWKKAEGTVVCL